MTEYYKDLISTTVPGKYIFRSNSFNPDSQIWLTCIATKGNQV